MVWKKRHRHNTGWNPIEQEMQCKKKCKIMSMCQISLCTQTHLFDWDVKTFGPKSHINIRIYKQYINWY